MGQILIGGHQNFIESRPCNTNVRCQISHIYTQYLLYNRIYKNIWRPHPPRGQISTGHHQIFFTSRASHQKASWCELIWKICRQYFLHNHDYKNFQRPPTPGGTKYWSGGHKNLIRSRSYHTEVRYEIWHSYRQYFLCNSVYKNFQRPHPPGVKYWPGVTKI
mgnify:CR=1 FL=1